MKEITCVVIGGGHAGVLAVHSILKASKERQSDYRFRIILIDKETYHLRKVLLFKPAAGGEDIRIPWNRMFPNEDVRFVQGTVLTVESENKTIRYQDANGKEHPLVYDYLVVTVGSVIQTPDLEQGGIALTGLDAAARIQTQWRENIRKAAREFNVANRQSLLTVAVAGAGISGIETSAELAQAMRAEAVKLMDFFCFGLGPNRGMVWTCQWGLDIIITGKLGWKIRLNPKHLEQPKAYLCKMVTNRCLDLLRSARKQREQYFGPWLPEPILTIGDESLEAVVRSELLSYAMLVLLERLSPAERAVFVLREALRFDFPEISRLVNKSEVN